MNRIWDENGHPLHSANHKYYVSIPMTLETHNSMNSYPSLVNSVSMKYPKDIHLHASS